MVEVRRINEDGSDELVGTTANWLLAAAMIEESVKIDRENNRHPLYTASNADDFKEVIG